MTSLVFLALAHASSPSRASASDLLDIVNTYRAAHRLEALRLDDNLCHMADGHALFMSSNHLLSHRQSPTMANFTGIDLAARAATIHWQDELSELVGYASTSLTDAVQAIFDSPCHRSRFLKPGSLTLGASAEGQYVCLLIGGESNKKTVVSPPDGATDIPTTWYGSSDFAGTRTGPGGTKFGYPIVYVANGSTLAVSQVTLRDQSGENTEVIVRDPSNDHHYTDGLAVIPTTPLRPSTTYSLSLDLLVNGERKMLSTSFTTAKQNR